MVSLLLAVVLMVLAFIAYLLWKISVSNFWVSKGTWAVRDQLVCLRKELSVATGVEMSEAGEDGESPICWGEDGYLRAIAEAIEIEHRIMEASRAHRRLSYLGIPEGRPDPKDVGLANPGKPFGAS